ncbi:hypothetical protein Z043_110770 [Scleropages formosus]|uniref:PAR14-like first RRM domain-containing protein n=1 Tax=Scleropages formosus TaxID=113540 RepID=A0A0P7VBA6_SCLFO|nr:hypothetical protein Z043_110770 [Scleropages formosus]
MTAATEYPEHSYVHTLVMRDRTHFQFRSSLFYRFIRRFLRWVPYGRRTPSILQSQVFSSGRMEDHPFPVVVEGDWEQNTNKVKKKLQIYFQSPKNSGGGECVVEFDTSGNKAIVWFKSDGKDF